MTLLLYLDQNYLSGFAKGKPAFGELQPVLRTAVAVGVVAVVESSVHERVPSPAGPGLARVPARALVAPAAERARRRVARGAPPPGLDCRARAAERRARGSDAADLDALAAAICHCELVSCDAFVVDVVRRSRLDLRHGCELFSGRRPDVLRLRDRLQELTPE